MTALQVIHVTFIDRLTRREVYTCSVSTPGLTERDRCRALQGAYVMARARGVNVADGHIAHRFS